MSRSWSSSEGYLSSLIPDCHRREPTWEPCYRPCERGWFEGPRLKSNVIPGGGDWLLSRPDGVDELNVRGTMQTDDGALISISYRGSITKILDVPPRCVAEEHIPHEEYYFAATLYFETSASQFAWLQQGEVIGRGFLVPSGVGYHFFAAR